MSSGRLGQCEVCSSDGAKYTCPKCSLKTCCLTCVKIHKKELDCDGVRDKTAFKKLSKFSNMDLLNDYRLMEEVNQCVVKYRKDVSKRYTRGEVDQHKGYLRYTYKNLPAHLFKLRGAARRRRIQLEFLPQLFTRHECNSTYFNWKTQNISWRIEWVFPMANNIKCVTERAPESDSLSMIASQFLDPNKCDEILRNSLQFYQSAGAKNIVFLLKVEHIQIFHLNNNFSSDNTKFTDQFYELDPSLSLNENLQGKNIIEFPVVYLVIKGHEDVYNIISSDLQLEEKQTDEESVAAENDP